MTSQLSPLPGGSNSGEVATWSLGTVTIDDPDVHDGVLTLENATFLGVGTTRRSNHVAHPGPYTRGERCGACRWFETRLFKLEVNDYVLHHTGRSLVPGEVDLCHHERAFSPYEVIELYTTRQDDEVRVTRPGSRALAQAITFDDDLRVAYHRQEVR